MVVEVKPPASREKRNHEIFIFSFFFSLRKSFPRFPDFSASEAESLK